MSSNIPITDHTHYYPYNYCFLLKTKQFDGYFLIIISIMISKVSINHWVVFLVNLLKFHQLDSNKKKVNIKIN